MIVSSNDNNNANAKDKNQNKNTDNSKEKKENKFLKITDPNNTNGTNPEAKKETPLNTATSNISGKYNDEGYSAENWEDYRLKIFENRNKDRIIDDIIYLLKKIGNFWQKL